MTYQTLLQLADIIQASKEPIETDLQADKLTIRTGKNTFWIFLSVTGVAFSILLIIAHNRAPHNLELGLAVLLLSVSFFWKMQSINKTLILDLHQRTLSVIPNFFLQHWALTKLQRIDTILPVDNLPEMRLVRFSRLKYDW